MRNFSLPGRSCIMADNAMIATSHPIASSIGLHILSQGGSAIDAAIAATAILAIGEPHMSGIGGDCFALVKPSDDTDLVAINGSGRTPEAARLDHMFDLGITKLDVTSPHSVTVPGAVAAWWALHKRFGILEWSKLFDSAIHYAEKGIAVHPRVAHDWANHSDKLSIHNATSDIYLRDGNPYQTGDIFQNTRLASAYRHIAAYGMDGFYKSWIADDIISTLQGLGGLHQPFDFATTQAQFVQPISANYRGYTIWECPPNSQGIVALMILKIVEHFNIQSFSEIDRIHLFAEASKLAYAMRDQHLGDPKHTSDKTEWLLSSNTIEMLAEKIDMKKAGPSSPTDFPTHPDTIYLAAVDQNGMAVSFINSLFDSFGSGITAPQSGILLHSRGRSFQLTKDHPNVIAPLKRPMHTIIPAMITKDDDLIGPFGVMGGQYQAAGHANFISNIVDFSMDPQEAIDAPRAFAFDDTLELEAGFSQDTADALSDRGHTLEYPSSPIGGGQAIIRNLDNPQTWIGGSDSRKDGTATGF